MGVRQPLPHAGESRIGVRDRLWHLVTFLDSGSPTGVNLRIFRVVLNVYRTEKASERHSLATKPFQARSDPLARGSLELNDKEG
jgi:hypothetical protein